MSFPRARVRVHVVDGECTKPPFVKGRYSARAIKEKLGLRPSSRLSAISGEILCLVEIFKFALENCQGRPESPGPPPKRY